LKVLSFVLPKITNQRMKKLFLLFLIILSYKGFSQNLQLHYDFGEDRNYLTATLEMFKPDTFGYTFWFVDFDFNYPGDPRSMSSAYGEISHDFYIPGLKKVHGFEQFGFHLEYDDGFAIYKQDSAEMTGISYNSIFLTGFSYPISIGQVTLTTQYLLRMPRGMDVPDFQFTVVWFQPVLKNKLLITGYFDIWSQDKIANPDKKEVVFQAEPQFWWMVRPKLGLGGEIEISKNFPVGPNEWEFMPTLAFRWEF
jgi:hypothetical protein